VFAFVYSRARVMLGSSARIAARRDEVRRHQMSPYSGGEPVTIDHRISHKTRRLTASPAGNPQLGRCARRPPSRTLCSPRARAAAERPHVIRQLAGIGAELEAGTLSQRGAARRLRVGSGTIDRLLDGAQKWEPRT
jgi:hypothetical protein